MNGGGSKGLPERLSGRAHVFGDHVSTDEILPGRYLDRPYSELGQFAMAGIDETFASRVQPGDIIVAGNNFGCGSSREAAVMTLKHAGIAAVVAPSFARIFFRNAVNNGLLPVVVSSVDGINSGQTVEIDLVSRRVRVLGGDRDNVIELPILNLQGISREILEAGGIIEYARRRMAERQARGTAG